MLKMDGWEVLQEIKKNDRFKYIFVIIFIIFSVDEDVKMIYESGGNIFFIKLVLYEELVEVIGLIFSYWFGKVEFCSVKI